MNLASRVFLFAYAVAMAAVAAGYFTQYSHSFWPDTAVTAFFYFILAVGYAASRDRERAPTPVWLAIAFLSLLLLATPLLEAFSQDRAGLEELRPFFMVTTGVLAYLVLAVFMLRDFRLKEARYRLRRILVPAALVGGASLAFSSLFLAINDKYTGWNILLRKVNWITAYINVGAPPIFGEKIEWLQPIYAPGGYITYVLAMLATVAILLWLFAGRMSIDRSRDSSLLTLPAVIICLAAPCALRSPNSHLLVLPWSWVAVSAACRRPSISPTAASRCTWLNAALPLAGSWRSSTKLFLPTIARCAPWRRVWSRSAGTRTSKSLP